jgi:transposase
MYVYTDPSINGHCFICFVGLLLLSLLVQNFINRDIPINIPKLIDHLRKIRIIRIHIPGKKKAIEKVDLMSSDTKKIYETLNLDQFL